MAKFDRVPENAQSQVAAELGEFAQTLGAAVREVGETFPIFVLDEKDAGAAHVKQAAKPANRITSLIYESGAPTYTSEAVVGENKVSVSHFPGAPNDVIAKRFQDALAKIDQDFPDDSVVRQLEIPDFRFVAFWVEQGDHDWIYPIEPGASALSPLYKYNWDEARAILSKTDPIIGLIDEVRG